MHGLSGLFVPAYIFYAHSTGADVSIDSRQTPLTTNTWMLYCSRRPNCLRFICILAIPWNRCAEKAGFAMRKTYIIVVIVLLTVRKAFQLSAYRCCAIITVWPSDTGYIYAACQSESPLLFTLFRDREWNCAFIFETFLMERFRRSKASFSISVSCVRLPRVTIQSYRLQS